MTNDFRFRRIVLMWLLATALMFAPVSLLAEGTNNDAPDSKYSISEDVRLGREVAELVEQRMPILPESGDVHDYVERVGQRLANGIPCEFGEAQARMSVPESEKPTSAQQRAPQTQRRPPIIDMHMHADLLPMKFRREHPRCVALNRVAATVTLPPITRRR